MPEQSDVLTAMSPDSNRSTRWHTGRLMSASADTPLLMKGRRKAGANEDHGVPGVLDAMPEACAKSAHSVIASDGDGAR